MATWTSYSTGNDTISLVTLLGGNQPKSSNTFYLDGLAGTDTLDFVTGNKSYASKFISTNFVIGVADASGVITVTGASTGGKDKFIFYLKSVESIKFNDTIVPLDYGTPPPPPPPPVVDTIPPAVSIYSPNVGGTGVAVGSNIVLTFNEAVQKGTGTIAIHTVSATGSVVESYDAATSPNLTVSGSTLTINPTADLAAGTHYFVTLTAGSIKDIAGNNYSGTSSYDFTTLADTTPPIVSAYSPNVGGTGIAVGSNIVLSFNEAVQKGTGTIAIHIGTATGTVVESYDAATSPNMTVSGSTLTINPTADLAAGTHYFVTLTAGSIKDIAGNNYSGTSSYDFTTTAPADTTPPTISAFTPADGATGIATGSDIVITFSEAVQKGAGAIEIHSGSATGALVASYDVATSASISVSGSTLTINPTANLANNTHYYVTLASGSIKDVAGNNFAGTTAYDFTTSAVPVVLDTTPPNVVSFIPSDAAINVDVSSNLVLTFNESVQRGLGVIEIHSGSATGAVVESYDAATSQNLSVSGSTLTINPTTNLVNNTHYYVSFAAGSIKDIAGNSYAGSTAYDFTTAVLAADSTPPIVSTYNPTVGASGVSVSSDIVLSFSEAVQKGSGVIELHSGSSTGQLIASYDAASSSNLTVSGNTLTINPTADLANGTHYYVTLAAGSIKDVAGNSYAGTTAYDFSTSAGTVVTDTAPPTVISFNPAKGSAGADISSDIVLTFSEAIQKGTGAIAIHSGSSTGTVVASSDDPMTETISISGSTLTIHHTNNLANSTHYFVTFGQGSINDLAGNHFDGSTPYDFTTVQAPIAAPIEVLNAGAGSGNSDTAPAIVGVGILGVLAWVLF
jgi:methionine-rich copper-binding protein CopC